MPKLRILIMDGFQRDVALSGHQLPRLAMLSWRDASACLLPFNFKTFRSAAVLDVSGNAALERLPADLQACLP